MTCRSTNIHILNVQIYSNTTLQKFIMTYLYPSVHENTYFSTCSFRLGIESFVKHSNVRRKKHYHFFSVFIFLIVYTSHCKLLHLFTIITSFTYFLFYGFYSLAPSGVHLFFLFCECSVHVNYFNTVFHDLKIFSLLCVNIFIVALYTYNLYVTESINLPFLVF